MAYVEHMTQGERLDAGLREAAKRFECQPEEIRWASWLEVFGSTSGPRGGIGGAAMTWFRVTGYEDPNGTGWVKECAGMWKRWNGVVGEPWQ